MISSISYIENPSTIAWAKGAPYRGVRWGRHARRFRAQCASFLNGSSREPERLRPEMARVIIPHADLREARIHDVGTMVRAGHPACDDLVGGSLAEGNVLTPCGWEVTCLLFMPWT